MKKNNSVENIRRINRVLRTIHSVNQHIVREKGKTGLAKTVCDALTENRSYYNAWIVLWDNDGNMTTAAESGIGGDFTLMTEKIRAGLMVDCIRKSLHQSGIILTLDPFSECASCPLSNTYAGRGAMTMRLNYADKVLGILCVSIPKKFFSDNEEQELFREVAEDVSFRLNAIDLADSIRENEQQFRTLIENSPTGISIIQNHQVVFQNNEQERLFGPTPRATILVDTERIHAEDAEKVKKFYRKLRKKAFKPTDTDFRFFQTEADNGSDSSKWIYCRACPINYNSKDSVLLNTVDMTELKALEQLLRIQDKMASLGRVAAGIAHEIRNPLSGINIYLNTLERIYAKSGGTEKIAQIIGQLKSASGKIESVIKRVMDFTRPGRPNFILSDINKPVEAAIELSSVALRKNAIQVEKRLSGDMPECYLDAHLIEEVILNMINNAAEAMSRMTTGKLIRIDSGQRRDSIWVRISDSGSGIDDQIRDKIFDPYYTTKNGGTGIGLNISQRIVRDHDGTLSASSSDLGGAEFTIEIPVRKGARQK